jgi:hypothetical protein
MSGDKRANRTQEVGGSILISSTNSNDRFVVGAVFVDANQRQRTEFSEPRRASSKPGCSRDQK